MKRSDRLKIFELQKGVCAITKEMLDYHTFEVHHAGLHNTKGNRKNYKLFLNSYLNCYAVNKKAHVENPSWGKISFIEADAWERFLQAWVEVCRVAEKIDYDRLLATLKDIRKSQNF